MGIYLNPGNENFKEILKADIYVDKTMMISVTNKYIDKGNKFICISRPRRFGKTIASEMLSAYYSKGCDSKGLFDNLKISSQSEYQDKLNKYNVIKIDLNSEYQNTKDRSNFIEVLSEKIIKEMRKEFTGVEISDEYTLAESLLEVYSQTDKTFIVIIEIGRAHV